MAQMTQFVSFGLIFLIVACYYSLCTSTISIEPIEIIQNKKKKTLTNGLINVRHVLWARFSSLQLPDCPSVQLQHTQHFNNYKTQEEKKNSLNGPNDVFCIVWACSSCYCHPRAPLQLQYIHNNCAYCLVLKKSMKRYKKNSPWAIIDLVARGLVVMVVVVVVLLLLFFVLLLLLMVLC